MEVPVDNALTRRLASLRLSSGFVLAGFVFNAGVVALLIAYITKSQAAALVTLALMAALVIVLGLSADMIFRKVSGARDLRPDEFPWLRPMVSELALQMHTPITNILVADDETPNAFTFGIGTKASIVFQTGLLDLLPREEVRAVAAHELGHVLNRDSALAHWEWALTSWVVTVGAVAGLLAAMIISFSKELPSMGAGEGGGIGTIFGIAFAALGFTIAAMLWLGTRLWAVVSQMTQLAFSRDRERLADATAAAITRQPLLLADALETLEACQGPLRGASQIGHLCIVRPALTQNHGWVDQLFSTHPTIAERAAELRKLADEELPEIDENWQGIGPLTWAAPALSVVALVLLALIVPACA